MVYQPIYKSSQNPWTPQIQPKSSLLQSRAFELPVEDSEFIDPGMDALDMETESKPGKELEFNILANIPISAPTPPPVEPNQPPLQMKGLTIGEPGDKYEQEADRVARKVVSEINSSSPELQQPPALSRKSMIQRKKPEKASEELTTEQNIFFQQEEYKPASQQVQELLAHNLTHLVQQNRLQVPALQRSPESDLIKNKTTWIGNLIEDELGSALLDHAIQGKYDFVNRVLDQLGSTNRDDVSYEMLKRANDSTLDQFTQSEGGRRMLDRLFDELTSGSVSGEETLQADRIMRAKNRKLTGQSEFQEGALNAKIFPYRLPGLTVIDDAPISARRGGEGKIWVNMPVRVRGTKKFQAETDTLPTDVFISGIELPENEIIGVKMYDLGGVVHYRPALYLIQLSNETTTTILQKMGEAAALGLTLGSGALVGAGAKGATSLGARVITWINRVAATVRTITTVIQEHRGWILEKFPKQGKDFLRYVDITNSAVLLYGGAQALAGMGKVLYGLRKSASELRRSADSAMDLSNKERAVLKRASNEAEKLTKNTKALETATPTSKPPKQLGSGPEPPKQLGSGSESPKQLGSGSESPKQLGPGPEPPKQLGIGESASIERFKNFRKQIDPNEIKGSPPAKGSATPGHAKSKHGTSKQVQADILNEPDRIFSGVNKKGRSVDIYYKNGDVVITEAGKKDSVITAYGKSSKKRGGKVLSPDKWARDTHYVEISIKGENKVIYPTLERWQRNDWP